MTAKEDTERLADALEKLDSHVEDLIREEAFWRSFIKGILAAVGAAIGATLVLTIIVFVLQKLAGAPFVGHYVLELLRTIQQNK